MKKSELIAAVMNNEKEEVPPRNDPRVLSYNIY